MLGYAEWRNFLNAIDKAKQSCKTTSEAVSDHFVDVTKTIQMPKTAEKEVPDIMLTRYACYLIAQNGDPKKEEIAFAQSYFAIQTRKQELLEERIQLMESLQDAVISTATFSFYTSVSAISSSRIEGEPFFVDVAKYFKYSAC